MSYIGLRKHLVTAAALTVAFFAVAQTAKAAPLRHAKHARHRLVPLDANGNVVGHRPHGCPHAFCGCEASLFLFGRIIPNLNLAANWLRFPRANPAPRMAAVREHHVFVLMRHVRGNRWLVHDGNSGGHKTREHVRSIAGYRIVNPLSQFASN